MYRRRDSGCTCSPAPQSREKKLDVIYRENLSVHPQHTKCTHQAEQESIFRTFLLSVEDLELQ